MKTVLSNRLYVPKNLVEDWHLDEFIYHLERGVDPISGEILIEDVRTYKTFPDYIGFHRGDLDKARRIFKGFEVDDQRSNKPLEHPISFKYTFRPEQRKVANKWLSKGYGICECPTGWGKSILGIGLICELNQKVLILAHQTNLLDQWQEAIYDATDIGEIEEDLGIQLMGIRDNKDNNVFPAITLSTFQSFMSKKGKGKCKELRDEFGLVIVDEAHRSPAYCFSQVFSRFNPKYRLGLTATIHRKDKMECVMFDIIGPVTAKGVVQTLPCEVVVERTGVEVRPSRWWTWTKMVSSLSKNEDRNDLILKRMKEDVAKGYKIIAFSDRVAHCKTLAAQLEQAGISAAFAVSGQDLEYIKKEAREGNIDVVIATKVFQEGTDVPRWDACYLLHPSANPPVVEQRVGRIRRPHDDKHSIGLIRDFCDTGHGAIYASLNKRKSVYRKLGFAVKDRATDVPTRKIEEVEEDTKIKKLSLGKWKSKKKTS